MRSKAILTGTIATIVLAGSVQAATVRTDPPPFAGGEQIHFNGVSDITSGFNYVVGHSVTNNYAVTFTSNEALQINNNNGGNATISAVVGSYDSLIVSSLTSFSALKFDLTVEKIGSGPPQNTTVSIYSGGSYVGGVRTGGTFLGSLVANTSGEYTVIVEGGTNELFNTISFGASPNLLLTTKHIEFIAASVATVPLPTASLGATGLLGMLIVRRPRR